MLKAIQEKLQARGLVSSIWHELVETQGILVDLFRKYYDGEHRLKLTPEMRKMMQITNDRLDRYCDNYCDIVVNTMSDRLEVETLKVSGDGGNAAVLADYLRGVLPAGTDVRAIADALQQNFGATMQQNGAAQAWVDGLMTANRFDALQISVHIATLRDGETYVMAAYDNVEGRVIWAHEPAFDGDVGMIVVWDGMRQKLQAAIKIWRSGDKKLVNIYYPDSIEYYELSGVEGIDGKLEVRQEEAITKRVEGMLGVPVIAFSNKDGDRRRPKSELLNVIPLQDSLNRGVVSMVMAEELAAFSILLAKGLDMSGGVTPGMVLKAAIRDSNGQMLVPTDAETASAIADYYRNVDLKRIEGGDLSQFIAVNEFFIGQIGAVSHTPLPQTMGSDDSSGEALKQRESGLLGKVGRAQVQIGNSWEDLLRLSAWMQQLYGMKLPPMLGEISALWKDAQIRNDGEIQASADWYWSKGFYRQALRVMSQSSIASHTEKDIERLLAERRADAAEDMQAQQVPGFENFVEPLVA